MKLLYEWILLKFVLKSSPTCMHPTSKKTWETNIIHKIRKKVSNKKKDKNIKHNNNIEIPNKRISLHTNHTQQNTLKTNA